ncbi:ParB N-terminal domain-containing protein [Burkholderia sp. BCC1996]|uniref:ParB N-terminal domain-containing protein n=1 Tax=unclassified Burkholderia TaxID=2613784 RepID=UPI0039EF39A4
MQAQSVEAVTTALDTADLAAEPAVARETNFGNEQPVVTVPYSSLQRSPLNVRTKAPSGIAGLAANIRAKGLLQNLVVHEINACGSRRTSGSASHTICGRRSPTPRSMRAATASCVLSASPPTRQRAATCAAISFPTTSTRAILPRPTCCSVWSRRNSMRRLQRCVPKAGAGQKCVWSATYWN